jgi:hypothetical protein
VGRLTAFALLVAFSFPLISSLLFAGSEPRLPACCRREGKHKCAMPGMAATGHQQAAGAVLAASPKCPLFPSGKAAPSEARVDGPLPPTTFSQLPARGVAAAAEQAEALYRVSFSRAWQKRGPPSPSLPS